MEESITNLTDFKKFEHEVKLFNQLKEPVTSSKPTLLFSDYLKWCEIQRIDKLTKVLESKG